MKKEWYTAKELINFYEMPKTPQGVNIKAKREGWISRRKRGVQGKAVEYHINSLPESLFDQLSLHEPEVNYQTKLEDKYLIWREAYYQLAPNEKNKIMNFILRYGLSELVKLINEYDVINNKDVINNN
ncbi:DNA-binding protein [Moellerella wisconsensis]|uniref:DNA-binding protein n=3 Tax=Moellerella wisconsensis TaxID=158849 RepID=A0A9Q8V3S5_9GAMM|nr:DNA-binding protein [Moellerella wisconsensis]UNH23971.1 DNA-binding protein [Moellerella wisconsensis]UNH27054.1 DNA-binding protein [Moellerella wisconsensis]UNH30527.1 DNA-binding protein [Moellerella wisconsensis]UNH38688.1 DNA-binding protein [Moellerella wisconsensis]UNH42210.1 DNA-binding protein [Moellerella wisconsensis]